MIESFNYPSFKRAAELFLSALLKDLKERGLPLIELVPDHLCFRVSTLKEYEFYKGA